MDITPVIPQGKQVITGYGNGEFRIGGEIYKESVVVFPDRTVGWSVRPNVAISLASLAAVLESSDDIELLLIGCAKNQSILPANIRMALKEKGINLEVMDTGAACRTYNVLLAEGRRVAAALVVV